jgi:hypothetical protein
MQLAGRVAGFGAHLGADAGDVGGGGGHGGTGDGQEGAVRVDSVGGDGGACCCHGVARTVVEGEGKGGKTRRCTGGRVTGACMRGSVRG